MMNPLKAVEEKIRSFRRKENDKYVDNDHDSRRSSTDRSSTDGRLDDDHEPLTEVLMKCSETFLEMLL